MYMPRVGSPSNSTQSLNHSMVSQMLLELEPLMRGHKPTQRICKAMMDKITAEVQLKTLINEQVNSTAMTKSRAKPKAQPGYPQDGSSPSAASTPWEPISPEQMSANLTEMYQEEMADAQ